MASVRFALGAEADIASGDELSAGFDSLRSDMKGLGEKPRAIMRPLSQSIEIAVFGANSTVQLVFGRPSAGRIWVMTRLTVLGQDDNTAVATTTAALYIGNSSTAGLGQCVRHGTAIPFTTTENERAYVCHDREDLFLNITNTDGSTDGLQIVANALVWEYKDSDIDAQVI